MTGAEAKEGRALSEDDQISGYDTIRGQTAELRGTATASAMPMARTDMTFRIMYIMSNYRNTQRKASAARQLAAHPPD